MLESRDIVERKLNAETHNVIGSALLCRFGKFLDKYHKDLEQLKKSLPNTQNIRILPITLQNAAFEDVTIIDLVHTDNKLLSRIILSLASVCDEINFLVKEAQTEYYLPLSSHEEENIQTNEAVQLICNLLGTFHRILFFIQRSQKVFVLTLQQLCAIMGKASAVGKTSNFLEPLDCIAELLVCLLTLESLLKSATIVDSFKVYRRSVRTMLHNSTHTDKTRERLALLDSHLAEIQRVLFSSTILKTTFEKCLNQELLVSLKSCNLQAELSALISQMLIELERDDENIMFTQIWLQLNVMFVLEYNIYGNIDKKIVKRLLEVNRKVSTCILFGNIVWYPEKFLITHIPAMSKMFDLNFLRNNRSALIDTKTNSLQKEAQLLTIQACFWMLEIENEEKLYTGDFSGRYLQEKCNLMIDGMKVVKKMSELIKWIINMHAEGEKPMTASVVTEICGLVEALKSVQYVFCRNLRELVHLGQFVCQHITHKALILVNNLKRSFKQEKAYKEQQIDVLSALNLAEHALKGPNTVHRILITKVALSASGLSNDNNLTELRHLINRLELICHLQNLMNKLCNCSFLYWHSVLLPSYFTRLIKKRVDLSKLYIFLGALSDCATISDEKFSSTVLDYIKTEFMAPLNHLIETNLRIQTHLHLALQQTDPFKQYPPNTFFKTSPMLFISDYLNIKQEVEHYLSNMFYNLTTVVMHDWKTYGEMRRMAELQYGLQTVADSLPMQTLEQGLDVLEIMRNIQVFVGKYLYNLNNQVFVEEWSNNKHLNTINISHVANSIRTHGIGIMNTTVNFTYQFLRSKFFVFSQFMFDEQIKSRLLKDLRYFSEHRVELNQMYPYERAEKFNVGIKKLGLNENGLSYLDLFRKLISYIGNAMGYIRLIRSGGRRCLADGTCFIPDLKSTDEFNRLLEEVELTEITKSTFTCFRRDLNNLVDNFEEATEYFKLLVGAFAPAFRNPENVHLKNFFIIVPPLTINFVEHSLMCKEKLNKKNRVGASFTDDGFAMGLAYIMELLEQTNQFKSLHWFQSVSNKFKEERDKITAQKSLASKEDVKLQQTLSLTEKRINAFEKEFLLLYYNYGSARIFFQS